MKASLSVLSVVAAVVLTAGVAQAASSEVLANGRSVYGVAVTGAAVDKVVDVKDGGHINIDCGQVVEFRDGAKTFTWKFDTVQHRAVNLAKIAPADFAGKKFTVYVDRNDAERN